MRLSAVWLRSEVVNFTHLSIVFLMKQSCLGLIWQGGFQRWNAGLATYAIEILSKRFPVRSTTALEQVEWAGRWQTLEIDGRKLILDATHNPEGAAALKQNLSSLTEQPIIIAGTFGKDRAKSLMAVVSQYARELYLVTLTKIVRDTDFILKSCLDRDAIESDLSTLFPKPGRCAVGKSRRDYPIDWLYLSDWGSYGAHPRSEIE